MRVKLTCTCLLMLSCPSLGSTLSELPQPTRVPTSVVSLPPSSQALGSSSISTWCTLRAGTGPSRRDSECRGYYIDCDRLDASPSSSGACGSTDTLDPLVRGLATRWSSDPGSRDPVPATGGSSDPC